MKAPSSCRDIVPFRMAKAEAAMAARGTDDVQNRPTDDTTPYPIETPGGESKMLSIIKYFNRDYLCAAELLHRLRSCRPISEQCAAGEVYQLTPPSLPDRSGIKMGTNSYENKLRRTVSRYN